MIRCPLCFADSGLIRLEGPDHRIYWRCARCSLISVDPSFLPTVDEEAKRYNEHNNGIQFPGYVRFLTQAVDCSLPHLAKGSTGLDYGCGPVPTLSLLLQQEGMNCRDYDPIFHPHLPAGPFEFIFATESFEHFFNPGEELVRLRQMLVPGGLLTIMTLRWTSEEEFPLWHYPRDHTHVSFYHADTFRFICDTFAFDMMPCNNPRVTLLKKRSDVAEAVKVEGRRST